MVIFEAKLENRNLFDEVIAVTADAEQVIVSSLDGGDLIQVIVPIVSIIAPLVAQTVQKLFADNRATIKYDGIEISAIGYDNAMKMFKEIDNLKRGKGKENEY
ncbi:hypothetical protein AGMMS50212_15660 [Spirochaetia bacterium]|nr:hypothetical protein AGMMS50212_15660 [Spirochaetia bacterium]